MARSVIRSVLPLTLIVSACATAGGPAPAAGTSAIAAIDDGSASNRPSTDSIRGEANAAEGEVIPMPAEVVHAVENRIEALKTRGGECSRYGSVLEQSFRSGRITLRPYMWRVGRNLASGEAKPNGDMMLAREIDSLNVGVRTVDDVVLIMEHEAVHIAFDLASGNETTEERANQIVRACNMRAETIGGRTG